MCGRLDDAFDGFMTKKVKKQVHNDDNDDNDD